MGYPNPNSFNLAALIGEPAREPRKPDPETVEIMVDSEQLLTELARSGQINVNAPTMMDLTIVCAAALRRGRDRGARIEPAPQAETPARTLPEYRHDWVTRLEL